MKTMTLADFFDLVDAIRETTSKADPQMLHRPLALNLVKADDYVKAVDAGEDAFLKLMEVRPYKEQLQLTLRW